MHHLNLVSDLGVVLLCAAVVALIFVRFKIPVFLGYILSGVIVGPYLFQHSPIHDLDTVTELSELGVIFLMFYIGMEFDLRRLKQVLGPAAIAVTLQTVILLFLGVQAAPLLGWGLTDGLFLGALLAISSSMVTIAILRDLNRLTKPHAQIAVGILILEDILAVAMLVILSGVAVSGSFEVVSVLSTTFIIAAFVVIVFFTGRLVAPFLLGFLEKIGSQEVITICAIAFALAVSLLAMLFDFSVALGAFLAGSVLSQTSLVKEIERATEPLRNVFCAVFFVSAGMLIQPNMLLREWDTILLLSVLVALTKVGSVWLGLVIGGQKPDTSFRASVSKSQIGEFSFIIAALGQSLGVTDSSLMTIAVGVSVLTTASSLVLSINADPIFERVSAKTPLFIRTLGRFYLNVLDSLKGTLGRNAALMLIKRPVLQILFNFLLVNGVIIVSHFLANYVVKVDLFSGLDQYLVVLLWLLAAGLCLPFITAMFRNMNAIIMILSDSTFKNLGNSQYLSGHFRTIFNGFVFLAILIPVGGFYFTMAAKFLPTGFALGGFVLFSVVAIILFWRRILRVNSKIEIMFMESFNAHHSNEEVAKRDARLREISQKYPWPVSVSEVIIDPNAEVCGKFIKQLSLREESGASIIGISRNGQMQYDPGPETLLFPMDHLFLFGSETQSQRAQRILERKSSKKGGDALKQPTFKIEKIYIGRENELVEKTLAGANLRKRFGITILGIQRGEERITAPSPDEIIWPGDVLYVIGNLEAIQEMQDIRISQGRTRPPMKTQR